MNTCGWMDGARLSKALKGLNSLGYQWQEKKEVVETIFSSFRTRFTPEESFHPLTQLQFVECIYSFAEAKLKWGMLPGDLQRVIYDGIGQYSTSVYEPRELSRLCYG
jgi:hypothetical protein